MKDWLIQAFAYDLFANQAWIETLSHWNDPEANDVMRHSLQAQRAWLSRIDPELAPPAQDSMLDDLQALHHGIVKAIEGYDLDHNLSYKNLKGEPFNQPLWEILAHVANHGTYHRGQLRGMAGGREFPETDLILYFRRLHD